MGEAGLTDANGNMPTVRSAQQTWYRVCQNKERAGINHEKTHDAKLKTAPFMPPVEDTTAPTNKFGPAKPKGKL